MYIDDNDTRSPRDRVSEDDLTRYLLQERARQGRERQNDCRGNPVEVDAKPVSSLCGGKQNVRQSSCSLCGRAPDRQSSCSLCERAPDRQSSCAEYTLPLGFPLAAVYVPVQAWRGTYDECKALERGTLFMELDKPLEVTRGRKCR